MNVIENRFNVILSSDKDIATGIIEMCDDLNINEMISLSSQLQNELRTRLSMHKLEETVWDRLLTIMSPNEMSEDVLDYLIQNRISLPTLCHVQLQDKWLMKLIAYDEAPLYMLAKRYYLSDQYSILDFLQFYYRYLWHRNDISLHLLDIYRKNGKRRLLIFLCSKNKNFEHKESLRWHQVADQIQGLTNSADITSIYKEHKNVGIVLAEIATNYFTSDEILLELSSVKGIPYASEIRKNSERTLKMKRIVEQHW